jgi:hypothetical protein
MRFRRYVGFPPLRQKKGARMGHGAFVGLRARSSLDATKHWPHPSAQAASNSVVPMVRATPAHQSDLLRRRERRQAQNPDRRPGPGASGDCSQAARRGSQSLPNPTDSQCYPVRK